MDDKTFDKIRNSLEEMEEAIKKSDENFESFV